jgi:hypothetical protein
MLVFVGIMLVGAVMFWAMMKNRKSTIDPEVTEEGTRRVYAEEQRMHERDGNSGL